MPLPFLLRSILTQLFVYSMPLTISKGFTLIELMIVVSVIGILGSIALPTYQDYIAKAQAGEAVKMLGGARSIIEEDVYQTAIFPTDTSDLHDLGVRTQGKYGIITTLASPLSSTGSITYTFLTGNSQLTAANKNAISLSRDFNGVWVCSSTLPENLAPKTCSTD